MNPREGLKHSMRRWSGWLESPNTAALVEKRFHRSGDSLLRAAENQPGVGVVSNLSFESQKRQAKLLQYGLPFFVFALTLLSFLPTLRSGFVRWSDYETLIQNPAYRGLTWDHLRWMFTTFYLASYRPLAWISFGLDYTFWGMNPFGYHLTSLLLHAINAALVYCIAVRLLSLALPESGTSPGPSVRIAGGFAALLFSIHPLRCEVVDWISSRGHLLAALFFLLALIAYLRAVANIRQDSPNRFWLVAVAFCYALSLLSQPSEVALPLILLLLDVYPLKRLTADPRRWFASKARRVLWEKIPFLVLALAGGLVGLIAKEDMALPVGDMTLLRRAALIFHGLAFYVWKTLVPTGLSPGYEVRFNFDPLGWPFLVSGLAVLGICVTVFTRRHRWPAGLTSWFYYLLVLIPYVGFVLPVLGTVENGRLINPDRYSYLACLPCGVLAGAGLHIGWQTWFSHRRGVRIFIVGPFLVVLMLGALFGLTWRQTEIWHDSYTLWKHAVKVTDRSPFKSAIAHDHLGVALADRGDLDNAIKQFSAALQISPSFPLTHNNLGIALAEQGKLNDAIRQFTEALRINPTYAQAHYNLGHALLLQGKVDDAIKQFSESLGAAPNARMHYQVAAVFAQVGKISEAIGELKAALELDPNYQPARRALKGLTASDTQ